MLFKKSLMIIYFFRWFCKKLLLLISLHKAYRDLCTFSQLIELVLILLNIFPMKRTCRNWGRLVSDSSMAASKNVLTLNDSLTCEPANFSRLGVRQNFATYCALFFALRQRIENFCKLFFLHFVDASLVDTLCPDHNFWTVCIIFFPFVCTNVENFPLLSTFVF